MENNFRMAVLLFIVVLIVYCVISYKEVLHGRSFAPHHVFQAQSFLHGRLDLEKPVTECATYQGKMYVFQLPLPSVLMVPFAAVFGDKLNDVFFTIVFGAVNPALLYLILMKYRERGKVVLNHTEILWSVALFAFGTIHFYMSLRGLVWYTNQIVATTMTLGYLYFATDVKKALWAGLFCGLAFTSRITLVLGAMFLPLHILIQDKKANFCLRNFLLFVLPLFMLGFALAGFNYARFGNPFEFGYNAAGPPPFNLQSVTPTFYHSYLSPPILRKGFPYLWFSGEGMSFFITMPAFLSLIFIRRFTSAMVPFLITTLAIAISLLFLSSPGRYSFGPRYTLDYIPYLLLFLLMGLTRLNLTIKFLIGLSIAHNTWGALIFPYEVWPGVFQRTILHDLFFR